MPLLSRRWRLLDIDDVEALVVSAIGRSRHAGNIAPHERDDLVQDALVAVWRASERHDPARGKFATVAYVVAQRTVVDRLRREHRTVWKFRDRVYERPRPVMVSLDDWRAELDDALATGAGDSPPDRLEDGGGLFAERDRSRARDLDALGLPAAR